MLAHLLYYYWRGYNILLSLHLGNIAGWCVEGKVLALPLPLLLSRSCKAETMFPIRILVRLCATIQRRWEWKFLTYLCRLWTESSPLLKLNIAEYRTWLGEGQWVNSSALQRVLLPLLMWKNNICFTADAIIVTQPTCFFFFFYRGLYQFLSWMVFVIGLRVKHEFAVLW